MISVSFSLTVRILRLEGLSVHTIALDKDVQQQPRSVKIIHHHYHWKVRIALYSLHVFFWLVSLLIINSILQERLLPTHSQKR